MTSASPDLDLITDIRRALQERANPEKAPQMQAYMKSTMLYLGVASPEQREALKAVFLNHVLPSFETWEATVLRLWRHAEYREERYAAIALTGAGPYRGYQTPASIPTYEEMIVDGAWWDYVDAIATRRVGPMLHTHPIDLKPLLLRWSRSHSMWKRRSAIISQVSFKLTTDTDLLFACIEPNLDHRDFFIRKAIGWALRELAKVHPDVVEEYVERENLRLSPLSRREAAKGIQYGRARRVGK